MRLAFGIILSLSTVASALAGPRPVLQGLVQDSGGLGVRPRIEVVSSDGASVAITETDALGGFLIEKLPSATYTIRVPPLTGSFPDVSVQPVP